MGVKLVALDIDGTILPQDAPPDAHPSPRLRAAVDALRASGVVVIVASGRMFPGTIRVARSLGLDTPVICQQGCSIHEPGGAMLHHFAIEREIAIEIVEYAREIDRAYEWFNPLRYIASRESPATREYGHVSGITPEYRPDPERSGVVPTGVGVISTNGEAATIHHELAARYPQSLHVLDFPTVTVAVAPDANKGHALSLLCADFGILRQDVLAIGDSVNDASMLAWAGHGLAVAHSDRYAFDAADEVLTEPGPEALAAYLEQLVRPNPKSKI